MMNDFSFIIFLNLFFFTALNFLDTTPQTTLSANRAFLHGDAVHAFFFIHNEKLIMAEECYFFLMASMRKLRMQIPLSFTLEFFQELVVQEQQKSGFQHAVIQVMIYREQSSYELQRTAVSCFVIAHESNNILSIQGQIEVDVIKEISVNNHFLSSIRTASPENIYAEIYAKENNLQDLILLNHEKRIARSIFGNYIFMEGEVLKIPKTTEGAYISPLMENFVTFIHKEKLMQIQECEMVSFESQKAQEILIVSDQKGLFTVSKIRKTSFGNERFSQLVAAWEQSFT